MSKLLLVMALPGVGVFAGAAFAVQSLPPVTSLIGPLLVILVLVLINGVFVAAEFAIIGVRTTQIEPIADEGNVVAENLLQVLEIRPQLDRYIATAQLGVTLASLGLAMYGEPALGHFVEPYLEEYRGMTPAAASTVSYIVALSLLTYLHVVLGEMVPKALALAKPMSMALSLEQFMRLTGSVFGLPVRILNGIGNLLLRVFRIPPAVGHDRLIAAEELELIVSESVEGGLIENEEETIIRNIFDFSERKVGQVMTPRRKIQALWVECSQDELVRTVTESRHSRFPVYSTDLDHIAGILHLKDLIRMTLHPNGPFDIGLILRSAPEVPENFGVEELLAAFKRDKLHMAIVRDEFGGLAGVVTLEDLVEEIVGEVRDEFDLEREPYHEIGPGVIEISGDYLLVDLAEQVNLGEADRLPDVETVGGLIVSLLGRPAVNGDMVEPRDGIRLYVLDIDKLAVVRARLEYPVPQTSRRTQVEDGEEE